MRRSFFFVILVFLFSCDSNRVFEDNVEFADRTWKISEPALLEFQIVDASKSYNLYLDIRNSIDYPYSRIFVNYTLRDSAGGELSKKMMAEYLFDQKTGKPNGSSGLGDIYDHQFPIAGNMKFTKPGKYKAHFEQFMRKDTLQGILAVGLRVEEVVQP
ncbi:MAG: gliding motility lipoprotein GldH [Cyclobacteriaceae bacterium]|jgi:gliding motility-associated lipoprotein GldH|nr:gliding motility lipoprotein GldH [Flammeovirgaceae bacterium]